MPFEKGKSGNPKGKIKGTKTKQTKAVKECVLKAFEHIGGVQNLAKWAMENQGEFYTKMYIKVMPTEVTGPDGEDISITITKKVHSARDRD